MREVEELTLIVKRNLKIWKILVRNSWKWNLMKIWDEMRRECRLRRRKKWQVSREFKIKKNMLRYFYLLGKLLFSPSISHNIPLKFFHFQFDPFNPSPYKIFITSSFIWIFKFTLNTFSNLPFINDEILT